MTRNDFKSMIKAIWYHTKVMWQGFVRMLMGAATAGLIALAVYAFIVIPTEDGWAAVCDFVSAILFTGIALCCVYFQGMNKTRGVRK